MIPPGSQATAERQAALHPTAMMRLRAILMAAPRRPAAKRASPEAVAVLRRLIASRTLVLPTDLTPYTT